MSVGIGRERQFEVYVGGARGVYPRVPVSFDRLERAARAAMSPEGYAYVAGGAGAEETMRENRAAFERWRIVPRDAARRLDARRRPSRCWARPAEPVRAVPDRRARDGTSRRRRRGRARCGSRGRPVRLLQPGVSADGGDREGDGRRAALVPALLEHVERARREPRLARRALRLLGRRAHARHDDARLADPRPRPRVPPVPAREGHRAVHERSGLRRGAPGDAAPGGAARRPRHARRDRDAAEPAGSLPGIARSRTCAPVSREPPSVASSRRTRARPSRGRTSRSSASAPGCRSC